jgi:diguanylate cyclase (GGDEF)-like protein
VLHVFRCPAALIPALLAIFLAAAAPFAPAGDGKDQLSIDFAGPVALIDLKDLLTPYKGAAPKLADGSRWYLISATNGSVRPVRRVLLAEDPPNAALQIFPRRARSEIAQVASSDSGVAVERLRAVGRHAYLVTIPPATSASLAIRVSNADQKPTVLAWNESALVAHKRQVAVFLAAVAGLIAAAAAIMAGVAIITAHPAPGWAAVVLVLLFLMRLQGAELLDAGWMTKVGGPYGMGAMLAGLALSAGIRLTDLVAPLSDLWPSATRWGRWLLLIVIALALAAFLGVPAATLITDGAIVAGAAIIAAYLVQRGLHGSKAARVVTPSASVFALVAAAAAAAALGAFQQNPMAPAIISGFTAAGAVLLALAIAAGEGIAILPIVRNRGAAPPDGLPEGRNAPDAVRAITAARQGVFDLDFTKNRLRLSREAAHIVGLGGTKTLVHDHWIARVHPDDRQVYVDALNEYKSHPGLAFRMEFRVESEPERYSWFELRASMLGAAKRGMRCLGLIADVTGRKEMDTASPDRILQDPLTGLGNRIALLEELETIGEKWPAIAFAILDIDRFKAIHGSLGDSGGDQLLLHFATRLATRFSPDARAFRVGGDSFGVVVPRAADYTSRLGGELIDLSSAPFSIDGRSVFAAASVGVVAGRDAEDPLELIRDAEMALTLAKRQGGGCWKVFTPNMEELVRGDAVALEADLRRGLNQNEFSVYYQPIVRLADGSVAGFEALLRWHHPEKGLISPTNFIAHSEETGLIVALGRFALGRAASDLADWQRYFAVDPPLFVSVNVSRRQLQEENFVSSVEKLLAAGDFPRGTFALEVTESAIEIRPDAWHSLETLRDLGAGLAIDDFGTGLSTLSQLKDLPFDTLKIDRSFLRRAGAQHEADATTIMSSIVTLAHELNRTVIVEGVEKERDAIWLKQLGCEFAQGFYFSPPLPPDEALKFIASHFRADGQRQARTKETAVQSRATGVG